MKSCKRKFALSSESDFEDSIRRDTKPRNCWCCEKYSFNCVTYTIELYKEFQIAIHICKACNNAETCPIYKFKADPILIKAIERNSGVLPFFDGLELATQQENSNDLSWKEEFRKARLSQLREISGFPSDYLIPPDINELGSFQNEPEEVKTISNPTEQLEIPHYVSDQFTQIYDPKIEPMSEGSRDFNK